MILIWANPLQLFLGPNGTRFARCYFRAHPFQWPSYGFAPTESLSPSAILVALLRAMGENSGTYHYPNLSLAASQTLNILYV
jgi:hypothetical protein